MSEEKSDYEKLKDVFEDLGIEYYCHGFNRDSYLRVDYKSDKYGYYDFVDGKFKLFSIGSLRKEIFFLS